MTETCENCGYIEAHHGENEDGEDMACKKFKAKNHSPQESTKAPTLVGGSSEGIKEGTQTLSEELTGKKSDDWESPEWILDLFDGFYDPCPFMAFRDYELKDGLKEEWKDKSYVNPPYSNPKPWVIKAIEENRKGKLIVMLLPVDTTTEWFKLLQEAGAHILFPNERLKFNGKKTPARWGCLIAVLDKLAGDDLI